LGVFREGFLLSAIAAFDACEKAWENAVTLPSIPNVTVMAIVAMTMDVTGYNESIEAEVYPDE
jgi:hypothetical protein